MIGREWLWVLNSVEGWHKGGDGPVCWVGEEEYGWQTVMEVEDVGGWKRFWVRVKNFFRGQGARGRVEPKEGSRFAVLGKWFHAATPVIEGGERSWIWAAVSLSMTTMRPPHLGQRQRGLGCWVGDAAGRICGCDMGPST